MSLSGDLDTWAAGIATATGMAVTRDPDLIHPPCVFVQIPDSVAGTLDSFQLEVPVWLVADGVGKPAGDQLLDNIGDLLTAVKSQTAQHSTLTVAGVDFPGYRTTARLYVTP